MSVRTAGCPTRRGVIVIATTCGSAIPAAVYLLIKSLFFCGTAGGIQAPVCTFRMPGVCKTSNRRGNTPPAAYVGAHVAGRGSFLWRTEGEQSRLWAMPNYMAMGSWLLAAA
jgi:hypothetical protein